MTPKLGRDPWAAWLGERGHGGDPESLRRQLELLAPIRDPAGRLSRNAFRYLPSMRSHAKTSRSLRQSFRAGSADSATTSALGSDQRTASSG